MSRPGGDRLRVTVYDMFGESPQDVRGSRSLADHQARRDEVEIVRSFLLYMKHYDIYPAAEEPYLAYELEKCCNLSREVQDKMYVTSILYGSIWARADGWSGLGKTIWAPEVDDEVDEDEVRKVIDYSAIVVDEEAVLEGMDEVIVQDVKEGGGGDGDVINRDEEAEKRDVGGRSEEEHRETLEAWNQASARG
jgi:hypothetical protein